MPIISTMKPETFRLLRDCAAILLIASALGLAWNRQLLIDTFHGRTPPLGQESQTPASALPMPLGLMQVKEFFDRHEAVLIDARSSETYAKGRIRGAHSIPLGEAESRIPEFSRHVAKDAMLIVYCNGFGCHDSMELGNKLIQSGFTQVFIYEGGYPEWRDAGYPTEGTKP